MSSVELFQVFPSPDVEINFSIKNQVLKNKPLKWSEARRIALHRDKSCRNCASDTLLTVHHIWPRGLGGTHQIANLVTLCEACHQHICSRCSRDTSARVPGWVKPDMIQRQAYKASLRVCRCGDGVLQPGFPETDVWNSAISIGQISRKIHFFWETAEHSLQ